MPKETFFNLARPKRDKIIAAAIKEFSRVPVDGASIENIIMEAKIPRGSFYQYFEDKEDAYKYVISSVISKKHDSLLKILKNNKGDIFAAFEEIFKKEFEIFSNDTFHNLMRNFISDTKSRMHSEVIGDGSHCKRMEIHELKNNMELHSRILDLVDKNLYSLEDDNSFAVLIGLLFKAMRDTMHKAAVKKMTKKEALNQFTKVINILKYGALKK